MAEEETRDLEVPEDRPWLRELVAWARDDRSRDAGAFRELLSNFYARVEASRESLAAALLRVERVERRAADLLEKGADAGELRKALRACAERYEQEVQPLKGAPG